MALNFNTDPYYDDYNEDKNFHRILFKPGVAVQARELTQLQTILQNQVARFGKNIFKPGSMVIPGSLLVDPTLNYVKLLPTYNSSDINVYNYLNREITSQTYGMKAKVLQVAAATNTDSPTLFVKYINSGNNYVTTAFADNEIITTSDTGTSYSATTIASSSSGKSISASISSGIFFVNDTFVKVQPQTIILGKYAANASARVGLTVTESIVTSDDDESLLDPAIGTYNYFAPGSDRYKILLTLDTRALDVTPSVADTFIELAKVDEGTLVSLTKEPGYNLLADELASRTFDESGNYTVDPFDLKVIEHLRSEKHLDGYITAASGGDDALGIAILYPGKAYVKGYKVSTIANNYLPFSKPRDIANVNSAVVQTPIGNYITVSNTYSVPNFTSDFVTVSIYNSYTSTKGSYSGTLIGNAKIRGYEIDTGNIMLNTSTFNAYLFDVSIKPGYTFSRDAKMLYTPSVSDSGYVSTAFTADIVPVGASINGSITLTNNSTSVTGVNTLFNGDLKVGDFIQFTSDLSNSYSIASIASNTSLTLGRPYAATNVTGVTATRNESSIIDGKLLSYIFPLADSVTTNITSPVYSTRRVHYATLASGNVSLTTAVNTTFAARSDFNYFAVVQTGGNAGKIYKINSANFQYTDGTSRNIKIILNGYGLSNEDVLIYTTILKTNQTPKTKTATSTTLSLTVQTDCTASYIPLGYADVYSVANVKMSSNAFGTPYTESNATDISFNYTLVVNQTPAYYGLSYIKLKPNRKSPSGPIQINFSYYAHGTGDYFNSSSYPDYVNIPSFNANNIRYNLRDCLDFRPRISNDGLNFKNSGAIRNEFLVFENNFLCNYDYYLPRTDKIYISSDGTITYKQGVSSLMPVEPPTPADAMPLYVIQHPAYGFDINKYSTFIPLDQKRYTMKDIGKLETRITNLEYYTTLTLLELDTTTYTVKDQFGLDRFKNGFIVDPFTGHGIGDPYNPEYNVSMDFKTGELLPGFFNKNYKLAEVNSTGTQRTANGYALVNNTTIMLSYTDDQYITNNVASDDEHINPFDFYLYTGTVTLSPASDTWFDTTELPIIYQDKKGVYDTMIPDSIGTKTYGSVWNSWKTLWFNPTSTDAQSLDFGVIFNNSTVTSPTSFILPYMRAVSIKFTAQKLKPLTRYYVFFGDYNLTTFCNTQSDFASTSSGILISDANGNLTSTLNYNPNSTGVKIPTGNIKFRITDSPSNSSTKESFADALFNASGTLSRVQNPYVNYNAPAPVVVTSYSSSPTVSIPATGGAIGNVGSSENAGDNLPKPGTPITVPVAVTVKSTFADAAARWLESGNPKNAAITSGSSVAQAVTFALKTSGINEAGLGGTAIQLSSTLTSLVNNPVYGIKTGADGNFTNILTAVNSATGKTFVQDLLGSTAGKTVVGTNTITSAPITAGEAAKDLYNGLMAGLQQQRADNGGKGTWTTTQIDFYNQKDSSGNRVFALGEDGITAAMQSLASSGAAQYIINANTPGSAANYAQNLLTDGGTISTSTSTTSTTSGGVTTNTVTTTTEQGGGIGSITAAGIGAVFQSLSPDIITYTDTLVAPINNAPTEVPQMNATNLGTTQDPEPPPVSTWDPYAIGNAGD